MDQRFGNYTTKSKSKKWTKVVLFYTLDTARVNSQTIYCLNNGINPRDSNSFDFGMKLAKALITLHIESRSFLGLGMDIQRRMTMTLGRDVNPKTVAVPQEMDNFQNHGSRRRCQMCMNSLPGAGYRKEASNLSKATTQCSTCGNAVCQKHYILLCKDCAEKFTFQRPQQPENDE